MTLEKADRNLGSFGHPTLSVFSVSPLYAVSLFCPQAWSDI